MISVLIFSACAKKEVKVTKEQMYTKAKAADASTTFVIPKAGEGPSCGDYAEGCLSTNIVQVKKLDLIAVEFMSEEQAIYAAKKVNGYYVNNWMLDDVTGEPTLERFAKSIEAKKP